ncbi:MAG TPA: EAL domain-containing protein [Thermoanaerobaculia bacterium]|nr:EAL domain-containing protein [Thermoanaerobaculia bacterium]
MATLTEPAAAPPPFVTVVRELEHVTTAIPIVVGVLVLYGWSADIEVLKRIVPGLVAMNPMTAIGFILLGLSLALLSREQVGKARHRIGEALAMIASAIGLIKILALMTPINLHIDQLFFADKLGGSDFGLPNQMAPNTALNFLLLGLALMNIDRRLSRWWPSQFLTIAAAMSSLLALMGYAYGVKSFYGIGAYIPMALHAAASFLVVAIGVMFARPAHGLMAVFLSESSGGVMLRRLLPAVLIIPAALGWIRHQTYSTRLVDPEFEMWLLVILLMTVFALLIGWSGRLLFRLDLDRAEAERTLTYQAMHDALTQLPNRRLFTERLEAELDLARKTGNTLGVLFLDLDLFKVVNDSLGHVVGDQLLIAAGKRISDALGERELAARISGDEFTILLADAGVRERAADLAKKLLMAFGSSFKLGPHEVFSTVSIGIAFSERDDSPVNLIRHSDIAMYQAKTRGKARYEIFDPTMDLAAIRRLELETELRRAIEKGELRVYYQPEVEIESGNLVGMEALVRWEHPERGLVSPTEFIAVAEETGLILAIGRWVLYEACRQAKEWQDKYRPDLALMVSVNLSGRHFQQATLIEEVSEVLKKTGINAGDVILEITESVAMEGAETTIEILTRLKSLGVQLAIDDFGTGFSSLAYLKRFPVNLLKIDKSFVDGIALQGPDSAIVEAIIALGHALGLKVIAEGVETGAQVDQLRALGSELGQGFYYGKPLESAPVLLSADGRAHPESELPAPPAAKSSR